MKRIVSCLFALGLAAMLALPALADVEVRLKDGSRWRGDVDDRIVVTYTEQGIEVTMTGRLVKAADLYVIVEGDVAGQVRQKTIFRGDIVSVRSESGGSAAPGKTTRRPGAARNEAAGDAVPRDDQGRELGVFVLPMAGMVGGPFRHDEIEQLGKFIDENYGPGQTIILEIDSNGGLVIESIQIYETIQDLKKRHRVIGWVKKAISAGCMTAMCCEEIYFQTEGTAGSVTTLAGGQSLKGAEAEEHVEDFVKTAKTSGYSEHIARAMKLNKYMCSYDKDPETGEVTFYGDKRGEFLLSDENSNLTFNASNALHCGFSKGTADTPEDLARLLNLPQWHEIDDLGRRIAKSWQEECKKAEYEIPLLMQRFNYEGSGGGDQLEILGRRLKILRELIRWNEKSEFVAQSNGAPPKEWCELQIELIRKQIADLRRAQRP